MGRLLGLIVVLTIGGLAFHFNRQFKLIQGFCSEMVGYDIIRLKLDDALIRLKLKVKNPSDIDVVLRSYDFAISVNNRRVATAKKEVNKPVASNGYSTLPIDVRFSPRKLAKEAVKEDVVRGLLLNPGSLLIKIEGFMNFSHGKLPIDNVPLKIEMTLKDIKEGDSQKC